MRELTFEEMEQVDGGALPLFPLVVAVGTGVAIGYRNGGVRGAAVGLAFSAPAAIFGGAAAAAYGVGRWMLATYSVGTALLGNEASRGMSK